MVLNANELYNVFKSFRLPGLNHFCMNQNGSNIETKLYWGNMEKLTKGSTTYEVYYLTAGNGLNNIIVKQQGSAINIYYTYTDQLGSIVAIEKLQRNIE